VFWFDASAGFGSGNLSVEWEVKGQNTSLTALQINRSKWQMVNRFILAADIPACRQGKGMRRAESQRLCELVRHQPALDRAWCQLAKPRHADEQIRTTQRTQGFRASGWDDF
jgi:hypothetical protein